MRKHLQRLKKRASTVSRPGLRQLKHVSKKPLFTIPFATFMALLASVTSYILISSGGNVSELTESRSNVVVVNYDKEERTIPTDAKNVGELLKRLEIKLNEGDVVEPAVSTEIASDNFRINVYRAVPVTIVDGDRKVFAYSAAATPRSIAKQSGIEIYPEDKLEALPTENFLTESSIGERVVIKRATPIEVNLYGTPTQMRTHATTVNDFLKEKKIRLDKKDDVFPAKDSKVTAGTKIFLVSEGHFQAVEEEVPMPIETVEDAKLSYGQAAVRQQGVSGKKVVTYQIELKDGKEVSRRAVQEIITQEPVKQIVAKGSIRLSISLETWLFKLRTCETGGNYQRNSANGLYFGAYQFRIDTWNAIARKVRPDLVGVRPDHASPADQDYMVISNANLSKGGLATQHPGCYKKEGLSAKPPANH
jgi:resuscitation-promoting factor RpfB